MATGQTRRFYPSGSTVDFPAGPPPTQPYGYVGATESTQPASASLPARSQSNSKSYAERAGGRPDLLVDTSLEAVDPLQAEIEDQQQEEQERKVAETEQLLLPADLESPTSPDDNYIVSSTSADPPRKESLPDRSPLQTLEGKLGDITKEEKRARMEEAEQQARLRSVNRAATGDWPGGDTLGSSRNMVDRSATVGGTTARGYDTGGSGQSSRVVSGIGTTSTVDRGLSIRARDLTTNYARNSMNVPSSPRVRSYGYDSSRTGGAAAAAVGAYQASRNLYYKSSTRSTSGPTRYTEPEPGSDSDSEQLPVPEEQSRQVTQPAVSQVTSGVQSKEAKKTVTIDPFPPEEVRNLNQTGPQYEVPPQTAGGQSARKQVAFGAEDPNEVALRNYEGTEPHRFRDLFHRSQHSERRYQASNSLDEWKRAGTVVLLPEDLDLDSAANDETWWERSSSTKKKSRSRTAPAVVPDASDQYKDYDIAQTTFNPPLSLKSGPLLRYTGLKRDTETERVFWRGSVMIVTEDATSTYDPVPTLRIFKQPMDLVPPLQTSADEPANQQTTSRHVDALAGLPKMSRTGQAVFVKRISEIHGDVDLSRVEDDQGLYTQQSSVSGSYDPLMRIQTRDGEKVGRYREVAGFRLHAERGFTFWRFNLQVALSAEQTRIAYRINRSAPIGFWIPALGQSMNVMFHSCNGFGLSADPNEFSGPDPLWRDVLNKHQFRPFHCMIGGGDQIYNDSAMKHTQHFQEWLAVSDADHKHSAEFTVEMQDELEQYYLNSYSTWFSQGLFGMANSQIPMVNLWDDHDIIDGFGSYPHHFMATPVFTGLGAIAFKYYMLFQHQSVPDESEQTEPSWLLGAAPGPYVNQLSRSLFMSLGQGVAFLGLDCRTERMRDEILSQETYDLIVDRCRREIVQGETRHLVVLLGVPIAYPRLNFLENVLTSRVLDPVKALGRAGIFSKFINSLDGGVEILDDLDDHWTAKHHKHERNWFVQELQELAAEKSVRVTILSGDVHLAAVGQFYSNPKLGIPKDHDHRYMPNIISSAIVNAPPPEIMADAVNKRNKVHHLDDETDEDMIAMFPYDVDGKKRNNTHLLPRRNWVSFHEYIPGTTPPPTPPGSPPPEGEEPRRRRSFSLTRRSSSSRSSSRDPEKPSLLKRLSKRRTAPPSSYRDPSAADDGDPYSAANFDPRIEGPLGGQNADLGSDPARRASDTALDQRGREPLQRSDSFRQRPTALSRRASQSDRTGREGHIDLQYGLDVRINCEVDQHDPAGNTTRYRLIVPALAYQGPGDPNTLQLKGGGIASFFGSLRRNRSQRDSGWTDDQPYAATSAPQTSDVAPGTSRAVSGDTTQVVETQAYSAEETSPVLSQTPTSPQAPRQSTDAYPTGQLDRSATGETPTSPTQPFDRVRPVRRHSASGPPPPSNIEELPSSVQRYYKDLNDPETQRYTRETDPSSKRQSQRLSQRSDPSRRRYSQMNDPDSYKRFSQYEPLERSAGASAPTQTRAPAPAPPIAPAPPPAPEDTHRRYSSKPMESPLLPASINMLRSSTHRRLQSTDQEVSPEQQRSASDPVSGSSAAYVRSLPVVGSSPYTGEPKSESQLRHSRTVPRSSYTHGASASASAPSRSRTYHGRDPYAAYDSPPQQPVELESNGAGSTSAGARFVGGPGGSWTYSGGGQPLPDKVLRHFGTPPPQEPNPGYEDDRYWDESDTKKGSTFGNIMRRFSEGGGGGSGRQRKRLRKQRYYEDYADEGYAEDDYRAGERESSWKFWQR